MKTFLLSTKSQKLVLILFLSLLSNLARSGEFVIMNRVVSWGVFNGKESPFWPIMPDATMPEDWLTPDDYYHGKIYTRYEVLGVATNAPFKIQFGIFQHNPDKLHKVDSLGGELCELQRSLAGVGSIAINSSSPSTWWDIQIDKPYVPRVDFSRVYDFQSMSPIICDGRGVPLAKKGSGADDTIAWFNRYKWYPATIRVTVIAVSNGSTFSGWGNYIIDPSARKPTPNYGVDYINETTDKVVPATDEYCMYSSMAGAVNGTGQKMPLTPGQDANFRTKAGGGLLVSEVQHFRTPCRPATPNFVIDNVNHVTTTAVSSNYEYSVNADMSGAITGNGTPVSIPAGTSKFFRVKATSTSFKSNIQELSSTTKLADPNEFVIFNGIVDFPNSTDTNGFYYFYYNKDMPRNWVSPKRFSDAVVYIRYEIISAKTSTPIELNFGIWQMIPPETGKLYETTTELKQLNGPGAIANSQATLDQCWSLNNLSIDFTKMDSTWHFGISPWGYNNSTYEWEQIRQENPTVWNLRNTNWFPMKVYVTIVAVEYNQSFSGWSNYLGIKQPTPVYTINYTSKKTIEVVPSTDEYSYSPSMSPAYSGTGTQLNLVPGQHVYFRTKAQGANLQASYIHHLVVPDRPSITAYTIDYTNEKTAQSITSDVQYANSLAFSSPSVGTGTQISVTPGQDLYFRIPVSSSSFGSDTIHLVSPGRPSSPSVSVDYINETTNEVLSSGIEYSTNISMTSPQNCANAKLGLNPGTDVFLRVKPTGSSFASLVTSLDVPARPATPAVTFSYSTESSSVVASNTEWSENSSFSPATQGTGSSITINPGTDLYLRVMATGSSFKSETQHIIVPDRPSTPAYSINYTGEVTGTAVSSNDEYSTSNTMSSAVAGTNTQIPLTPGTDMYLRTRATGSSFKSLIQHLVVPPRPETPVFTINYVNSTTTEVVGENIQYSTLINFSGAQNGAGVTLALEPGIHLYFRQKASSSSFKSGISELLVPEMNFLGYSGADTVTDNKIAIYALLVNGASAFSLDNLQVTNGYASDLRAGNVFDIYPSSPGDLSVKIPANTNPANSFASNEVKVYFKNNVAVFELRGEESINIYPNPNHTGIISIQTDITAPYSIELISGEGRLLKQINVNDNFKQEINIQDLQKGIYYLKIYTNDKVNIQKLILE
jgi:hypothetical protein